MAAPDVLGWIGWIYVLANTGRVVSYLPQIAAVWRASDQAPSISLLSWSYWSLSHLTGALYGGLAAQDWRLLWVSVGNFASCTTVVILVLRRRQAWRRSAGAAR